MAGRASASPFPTPTPQNRLPPCWTPSLLSRVPSQQRQASSSRQCARWHQPSVSCSKRAVVVAAATRSRSSPPLLLLPPPPHPLHHLPPRVAQQSSTPRSPLSPTHPAGDSAGLTHKHAPVTGSTATAQTLLLASMSSWWTLAFR